MENDHVGSFNPISFEAEKKTVDYRGKVVEGGDWVAGNGTRPMRVRSD